MPVPMLGLSAVVHADAALALCANNMARVVPALPRDGLVCSGVRVARVCVCVCVWLAARGGVPCMPRSAAGIKTSERM